MEHKKKEIKLNTKRITFSKNIKKRALLEFANGKSPNEVFFEVLNINPKTISKDKKYASKLLYKWKIEFCSKKENISENFNSFDDDKILEKIENIKDDTEFNEIEAEMQKKYKENEDILDLKISNLGRSDTLNF